MRVGANIGVIFAVGIRSPSCPPAIFSIRVPMLHRRHRSGGGKYSRSFLHRDCYRFRVNYKIDEAVNLRKAKARGVPNVLRCKEGLKHPSKRLAVHAGSGVGHGQHDVMTGLHVGLIGRIGLVEQNIRCFYGGFPPRLGIASRASTTRSRMAISKWGALISLYMVVLILATQRREYQLAQLREQLTLELAILSEQKTAKVIQLLKSPVGIIRSFAIASIKKPRLWLNLLTRNRYYRRSKKPMPKPSKSLVRPTAPRRGLPPALHEGATHSSNTSQRHRPGRLGFAVIGLACEMLFRFLAFCPAGHLTYDDEEARDNRDGDERKWGQLLASSAANSRAARSRSRPTSRKISRCVRRPHRYLWQTDRFCELPTGSHCMRRGLCGSMHIIAIGQ